jgi:hypothetical protein
MKIDLAKSGYRTLSTNISEFAKNNEMPIPFDIRRLNEGDGIEAAFIKNEEKYHESCRLMFNNTKLQRVQKRRQPPDTSLSDIPLSFKFTRKSSTAPTEERSLHLEQCFICEKQASRSELREVMTMQLNTRLHQCAQNLQDQKLLATLSAGDVVAQELKYHGACLPSLHNKERAHLRMKQSMTEDADAEGEINQIVFAELVTHVVETQRGSTGCVVFKLANLCNLYESRLKQFETNSTFNRTRLKNKLLLKIPELKPFHKGREVLLVFEKDVGPALVSACDYTDAMHLAKASEIVRREIFAEQNKFAGHFDRDSVVDYVPRCLVELVLMIEHEPDIKSQIENGLAKSDFAIAQLLRDIQVTANHLLLFM